MPTIPRSSRHTEAVTTPAKEHQRATRLRDYDRAVAHAQQALAVLGLVVRGREARGWADDRPPEVVFGSTRAGDAVPLPAGLWVALRREDVGTAVQTLTSTAPVPFLVSEHEQMGPGFRLQVVEEKRALPDVDRLRAQLGCMLGIPEDVVSILEEWGVDDPRTQAEIDTLLDSRFGVTGGVPKAATAPQAEQPTPGRADGLLMSVADVTDVLQLSDAQAKVLATLVRAAGVTIVS